MLNSGTSYDFYLETDLDAFDEPVDYSSKYQERYSYKDNGTINFKVGDEKTTTDIKQMNNESENTKNTPLSISPASSFCDLQNIVPNSVQSSVCNEESPEGNIKNTAEALAINISFSPEKDEVSKGSLKGKTSKEKSVTFGTSSVSETPLMFSRSSSVDSLSSFEQQSLFDDRSYVSALSTPASGVLSPSELPASPSELMSPGLLKSKSAFQFPIPKGNSSRNLPLSINFKLKEHENDADLLSNGVFDDRPKMFSDEGKSSATSSLSSLSFYEGSARVSVSILDQKTSGNVPVVDVSNDEDPSYAFADTKKEYKYEGQTIASNDCDDYAQNESSDRSYYQLGLNPTLRNVDEREHIELSSFVFEDTKNCYNDEGKFSTTSSLSSISFLDHGDHVPEIFQPADCSSLNNNVLHSANSDVVCSSSFKDSKDCFEPHEKVEPNLSATLVSTSLQPHEVCDEDSASEESDYDSEQERKDKELIDQLLTNSLEVSKSDLMSSESETSESDYDSEQERKDQELINNLLAQSLPAQVPKSKNLPINQKPDLLKSCGSKDRTHAPSKIFTSRGRETSSKQDGLKCSPVEVFDESSESDYDSEQERQDQELISKLLTTTTMPLQVPKLNIRDNHQSAQMSRSPLPKDIKDVSPNYACKTLRAMHQHQDYRKEQPSKGQYDNQFSQVQVSDESSESDYDHEQEMKDQELINNLLQPTMSLQGPRQQNHLFVDHQRSNQSKSSLSKDMKGATPKNFAYREPRNHMPQYRGELPNQSHCNLHCSHAQGYRDSVPDGSSDVSEKSDKLLLKLSNARKADKTLRNAKHIRQSYPVRAKPGYQIHKAPTPPSNFYDKKQNAQYSFSGRLDSVARHSTYTNVAVQPSDAPWSSNSSFVEINDSARVYIYRTEESPIITRSPSLSDLNMRPCTDDKNNHDRIVKNSRK